VAGGRGEFSTLQASIDVEGSHFRELTAYQLAVALAENVHDAAREWDRFEKWTIGVQLVRAADSIGANIAEGTGRWHVGDRRRLLFIARASLYETEHWVLQAQRRGLLPPGPDPRLSEVARTLNGLIKRQPPS
jgi:four helix bundle protein